MGRLGGLMKNLFIQHPSEVGETYWQHARFALWIGLKLWLLSLAAVIHAIFPFLCKETTSEGVREIHWRCMARRLRQQNAEVSQR